MCTTLFPRAIEHCGQAYDVPGVDKGVPELARNIGAPARSPTTIMRIDKDY